MSEKKSRKKRKLWFEEDENTRSVFSDSFDDEMDKQMKSMFKLIGKMFGKSFLRSFTRPIGKPIRFNVRVGLPKINANIPVSMRDTGKELVLQAHLPNVDKKDIKLSVTSNTVEISVEKKKDKIESKENFYSRTYSSSAVRRVVRLPIEIKEEDARAKFMDGYLIVVLPKLKKTKKKNIEVE